MPHWKLRLDNLGYWSELEEEFNQIKISVDQKWDMLLQYRKQYEKWPSVKYNENNVNLGYFWDSIKSAFNKTKNCYQNEILKWKKDLIELKYWDEIENNFNENKKKIKTSIDEKWELLLSYRKQYGKFPLHNYIENGIKLGIFLNTIKVSFKNGKRYKNKRENWIEELTQLGYLDEIMGTVISIDEKWELLLQYRKENGDWPNYDYVENNIKLGRFLSDIKNGKKYYDKRESWINELSRLGYLKELTMK